MNAVSFSAVSKIYGPNPEITWPLLAEGASRLRFKRTPIMSSRCMM